MKNTAAMLVKRLGISFIATTEQEKKTTRLQHIHCTHNERSQTIKQIITII